MWLHWKATVGMQMKPQYSWGWFRLACLQPVLNGSSWGHWKWSLFSTTRPNHPGCTPNHVLAAIKQPHYTPRNLSATRSGSQIYERIKHRLFNELQLTIHHWLSIFNERRTLIWQEADWYYKEFDVYKYPPAHLEFGNDWLLGYHLDGEYFVYHI